jgi:hypothetical protein
MSRRKMANRKSFQFGLRFALCLLTAFALGLGWYANRVWVQRDTVRRIQAVGGRVWYDFEVDSTNFATASPESKVPKWLLNSLGPDWFHDIYVVDVGSVNGEPGFRDDDLDRLKSLPRLRKLILRDSSRVTARGILAIGEMKSLQWGFLGHPQIQAEDLRPLQALPALSHLEVSTPLGDDGMAEFAKFPALKELRISSEGITDSGLVAIAKQSTLRSLKISGIYRMSGAVSTKMRSSSPALSIDDGSFDDWRFGNVKP